MLRRSWHHLLLLLLSVIGIGVAIYLTIVHYDQNVPLVCSASGVVDCARVLSSSFSVVPGTTIPISIPGLGWCVVLGALALVGLLTRPNPGWLRIAQFVWALIGIITVLYLVYVELVRLHAICAWCTVLHVIILITFLATLIRLPGTSADLEYEEVVQPKQPTKQAKAKAGASPRARAKARAR